VHVIYRNEPTHGDLPDQGMTFADTRVSREYFDSVDRNHNGTLSPTEILEALKFENLEKDHAGYFEIGDLRQFMTRIGR
jgi:hypothetical protein